MLPFTANEQVLYSAIPEMHSRHRCCMCCSGLSGKQVCNQSHHLSVLTGDINDHRPLSCFWTITFSFSLPPRAPRCVFTYLSICYYADYYGNIFTWMPLDNSIKTIMKIMYNASNLRFKTIHIQRSGDCRRQIRLTLNMYFCIFLETFCALVCII